MIARFMRDTRLGGMEFEMQLAPGFRPRRSGVSVSRFRPRRSARADASGASLFLLLHGFAAEVNEPRLENRMWQLMMQAPQLFRNGTHQKRFEAATREGLTGSAGQTSAVFLLTADEFLWNVARPAVTADTIDFAAIRIHGVDLDGYVLFQTAKDLCAGTRHITLSELTNPDIVSDQAFGLIVTAFLVERHGAALLHTEKEKYICQIM